MNNLNNQEINKLLQTQACPMVASVNWDPIQDTKEETVAWFEEFYRQPLSIRMGLLDDRVKDAILALASKYGINEAERIGEVSRIAREIFTRGIREREIQKRIAEKLKLNSNTGNQFMSEFRQIVLLIRNVGKEESDVGVEYLSIIPALKKYEKIGEYMVTSLPIKLDIFDSPVRPSVKNWLEDYIQKMGAESHSTLNRSNYLFNSENGKRLTSTERDRLGIILKSYDEKSEVMINKESGEIIFEKVEENLNQRLAFENFEEKKTFREKPQSKPEQNKPKMPETVDLSQFAVDNSSRIERIDPKKQAQKHEKNVIDLSEYM